MAGTERNRSACRQAGNHPANGVSLYKAFFLKKPIRYPELLSGGDLAPSVNDRFRWVETFEDYVKARGQLSSEQYSQRTGEPRKCVTPNGREFTQR